MNPVELERVFARIPPLAAYLPQDFTITPLAGYTNSNFHLRNAAHDWVLRAPRAETNAWIDRASEIHNQALAAELGIAPLPLWCDTDGYSLTPTLFGSRALEVADLADAAMLDAIVESVRRLHRSGLAFRGSVAPGELIERYFALLPADTRRRFRHRLDASRRLLPSLQRRDSAPVPSHNDLVLDNLLYAEGRVWLIDWEYSAMASPCWDLATLCNAAGLDRAASLRLLEAYCAGGRPMEESLLFDYRSLLQLLSDCWMSLLATPSANHADPFR